MTGQILVAGGDFQLPLYSIQVLRFGWMIRVLRINRERCMSVVQKNMCRKPLRKPCSLTSFFRICIPLLAVAQLRPGPARPAQQNKLVQCES